MPESTARPAVHFAEAVRALASAGKTTQRLVSELGDQGVKQIAWSDWTIKDVLGHLGGSLGALHHILRGEPRTPRHSTLEEINEERRQERNLWPLSKVMDELESNHARMRGSQRLERYRSVMT